MVSETLINIILYYKIANFVVMLLKMHDSTTMIMITMMLNHE